MVKQDYPFSLIVDTSTSIGLYHYSAVLIQTLEREKPVVYFYKLIEVGSDSTANGLLNALKVELTRDPADTSSFFKKNLVGFGADGASVNLGHKGGFAKKLEEYFLEDRTLYTVWCMPHRLELAIKAALKAVPEMNKFDETITAVTNFYNSRSYKRKAHLRQLALEENLDLYELHYAFRERWVMSDYTSVKALIKSWPLLVKDLEIIQTDIDFKNDWPIAKGIQNLLTKRYLVLGLHFVMDLLEGLKRFSLMAQQSAGILIGKEDFRVNLINLPLNIKENNGAHLTFLLKFAICEEIKGCTIENFMNGQKVLFKEVELIQDNNRFMEFKNEFLDTLAAELGRYFPENSVKDFDIFVPKKLPRTSDAASTYGHDEIQSIAQRFNESPLIASRQWQDLLWKLISLPDFCDRINWTPERFWATYLRSHEIHWGKTIQKLIRIVLVLPANSADAERSFSIMNHIKYDRRARLKSENLDHLLRIRINGPKELDRFASAKYARAWVNAGHLRTDDPSQIRKRKREVFDEEDVEEDLEQVLMSSDLF